MSDPSAEFRRELKVLRDQTNSAIDSGAVGDVEDSLDLYAGLLSAVLRTFEQLQEQLGVQAPSWFNPYGQEMDWLENDIRSFIERMSVESRNPVVDELLRFLLRVLSQFLEARELGAHRRFLQLTEAIFYRSLSSGSSPGSVAAGVLDSIKTHGEFRVAADADRLGDATVTTALQQIVDFLFGCFRLAVDQRAISHAGICAAAANDLLETLENLSVRSTFQKQPDALRTAMLRIKAYGLGGSALVLLALKHERVGEADASTLLDKLAPLVPDDDLWTAFAETHEDRGQGYPWSSWEIGFWPAGVHSGALGHLDSAIARVVAIRLLGGSAASVGAIGTLRALPPAQAAWIVGRVLGQLESAVDTRVALRPDSAASDPSEARLALERAKSDFERVDLENRGRLPLDQSKIDEFLEAAEHTWLKRSALAAAVQEKIEDADAPTDLFGLSSITPKDFFTDSEVFAEPRRVGENMGSAVRRGESKQILDAAGLVGHREIRLSDIRNEVLGALKGLRGSGYAPSVIAVNSWRIAHDLTASYQAGGSGGPAEIDGASLESEYVGDDTLCLVADFSKAILVRRWRLEKTTDEQHLLAGGLLRAGVRDMTVDYAAEVVDSNSEFLRDDNGRPLSRDEAIERLRNTVNTSLFCKVQVELVDRDALFVFRVKESE